MFNKITYQNHQHNSEVVAVTQVIEKSITPDRVTDMYDKVRDEVLKQIVASYVIESSLFSGVVIHQYRPETMTDVCIIAFKINGKEFRYDYPIKHFYSSHEEVLSQFVERFKETLSNELLRENVSMVIKKTQNRII